MSAVEDTELDFGAPKDPVDTTTASARLGHSIITITLDLYTHAVKALADQAAEQLQQAFEDAPALVRSVVRSVNATRPAGAMLRRGVRYLVSGSTRGGTRTPTPGCGLSGDLHRLAPALRGTGIGIDFGARDPGRQRRLPALVVATPGGVPLSRHRNGGRDARDTAT